mmetsp:Transcript_60399/g.189186  ORF Transcript_60399/g.189186 Transcript_60399/m.189186 type:complete len:263 (+) Transcript_60399:59-847(+)
MKASPSHSYHGLRAGTIARRWVPAMSIALVMGGLAGTLLLNRAEGHPISCTHGSLPLITAVLENGTERLIALLATLLAMPFNMAFAFAVWAVWQELGGRTAGAPCSDLVGPLACSSGGWVLVALIAANDRDLDPRVHAHFGLVGAFVLCAACFLGLTLRSLRCRMNMSICPQVLMSARRRLLGVRQAVLVTGFAGVCAFCALSLFAASSKDCKSYRGTALFAAIAEYAAVISLAVQYMEHAYEFHLLRCAGTWSEKDPAIPE